MDLSIHSNECLKVNIVSNHLLLEAVASFDSDNHIREVATSIFNDLVEKVLSHNPSLELAAKINLLACIIDGGFNVIKMQENTQAIISLFEKELHRRTHASS